MPSALSDTVVVTGAAGWLGQNLVRALAPERRSVRCLVREPNEAPLLELVGPSVQTVIGDVRDPATVAELFDGSVSATVFHAAGVIHPADGTTRPFFDVNVGGTQMVLDAARRAGAGRFVHVSSNSPFGANDAPTDRFTEDDEPNPYLGYGQSKLDAEEMVRRFQERGDLETVILRPPWFYGPFQPARQDQFFSAIGKGRFPIVGDGSQQRSMCFTGNLVAACLLAESATAAPGRAYWIADARPYTLAEIFEGVRQALDDEGLEPTSRRPIRLPRALADVAAGADAALQKLGRYVQPLHVLGELRDTIACDISRARDELGYDPQVALVEGMRASIRWCLARGASL